MINYRIRIKQIRKALFISRKVEPRYTTFDIQLASLYKAMTDYYCPCEKEVWPEVNRWLKMRKYYWYHHKASKIQELGCIKGQIMEKKDFTPPTSFYIKSSEFIGAESQALK